MGTNSLRPIDFICYRYTWDKGVGTMFLFYIDGLWDEDKLSIEEALDKYPIDEYNWLHMEQT